MTTFNKMKHSLSNFAKQINKEVPEVGLKLSEMNQTDSGVDVLYEVENPSIRFGFSLSGGQGIYNELLGKFLTMLYYSANVLQRNFVFMVEEARVAWPHLSKDEDLHKLTALLMFRYRLEGHGDKSPVDLAEQIAEEIKNVLISEAAEVLSGQDN